MTVTSDLRNMLQDPKLKRFVGVIILCMTAMATLLSLGFVGVAFATDNWKHVAVNRPRLSKMAETQNDTKLNHKLSHDYRYFDRVEGIFRVCFPMAEKPKRVNDDIYLSPLQEWCANIDYFMHLITNEGGSMATFFRPEKMTYYAAVWINLARSTIGAFGMYFACMGIACVVGLNGCWTMSENKLFWTSISMMFALVFGLAGMGLFHATDFFEKNKVFDERLAFYQTWPEMLQDNTKYNLGWSYIIAWFGMFITLVACILFAASGLAIKLSRADNEDEDFHAAIVNQAYESADYINHETMGGTMRRHASMHSLSTVTPMGVITHPQYLPPGYNAYTQPDSNAFYPADDPHFRKGFKEFSEAKL